MTVNVTSGGSASIAVHREELHVTDPRVGMVPNLSTDQGAAWLNCLAMAGAAQGDSAIRVDPGFYRCDVEATLPATRHIALRGYGGLDRHTTSISSIYSQVDLGAGKFALKIPYNAFTPVIEDITFDGPGGTVAAGATPAQMGGILVPTRAILNRVRATSYGENIRVLNDHWELHQCDFRGGGINLNFGGGALGQGDFVIDRCFLTDATRASIGLDETSVMSNGRIVQGHCGTAPFGIYRYASPGIAATGDNTSNVLTNVAMAYSTPTVGLTVEGTNIPANTSIAAVSGSLGAWSLQLNNTPTGPVTSVVINRRTVAVDGVVCAEQSWEGCHHAVFYDEAHVGYGHTGQWSSIIFEQPGESSTYGWQDWAQTNVAATGSAASNIITGVAVTNFAPTRNMRVAGTNIPANTTIIGVAGSSGNWSLTLSANPTGTVTQVTVGMRLDLAAYEVGTAGGFTHFSGPPSLHGGGHPGLRADSITAYRADVSSSTVNTLTTDTPGSRPFAIRGTYQQFGTETNGIQIGPAPSADGITLGAAVAHAAISKYDLVETVAFAHVQTSTNAASSDIVGVAIDDFVQGEVCVYAKTGFQSNLKLKNQSGATITQNAALSPDPANAGCVKTWLSGERLVGWARSVAMPTGQATQARIKIT